MIVWMVRTMVLRSNAKCWLLVLFMTFVVMRQSGRRVGPSFLCVSDLVLCYWVSQRSTGFLAICRVWDVKLLFVFKYSFVELLQLFDVWYLSIAVQEMAVKDVIG